MKPFAVFTVVRNENVFLRVWCNYYCNLSSDVDVFVLDDSSTDGSVEDMRRRHPGVRVRPIPPGGRYDLGRLRKAVEAFQRHLLRSYEVVVYTDVDEFLLRLGADDLMSFLERFRSGPEITAQATGWHCVQQESDPPLELVEGQSVLKHHHSLWRVKAYDKTLVSKVPLSWTNGFHTLSDPAPPGCDPNLVLLHTWMVDRRLFVGKSRSYMKTGWSTLVGRYSGFVRPGMRRDLPPAWKPLVYW